MSHRICLALDLVDDAKLIAEYVDWHRPHRAPAAIPQSIRDAGIEQMEIYRAGNRMFMIIDAADDFDSAAKDAADAASPDVQKWTKLMKQYQQPVPAAGPDGTWLPMERVYRLTDSLPD